METDIYQYLEKKWPQEVSRFIDRIEEWDAATKGLLDNRLLRSALYLSDDYRGFEMHIEMARLDPRDVYWQAEYECTNDRLRDFTKTFHQNGCIK